MTILYGSYKIKLQYILKTWRFYDKRTAKFEAQWDEETEKALEKKADKWAKKFSNTCSPSTGGGAVYGLGLVGALIYFISTATNFWMGAVGVLKAFVWPAYFVYEIFKYLNIS